MLEISSLSLSVKNNRALVNVNVAVNAGEICGLIGPAGSGKTATIFTALGLLRRSGGAISVFGMDPEQHARAIDGRCGVVLQDTGFYDQMSAPAYLRFFGRLYGHERTAAEIGGRLEQVGLDPRSSHRIKAFTPGMRRRLALARALIRDPDLLLLDEPTEALDDAGRAEIHALLAELAKRGTGILLATRSPDQVSRLCDRRTFINHGRTRAERHGEDRTNNAVTQRFRLHTDGPIPMDARTQPHVSLVLETRHWSVVDVDARISPNLAWKQLRAAGWPIIGIQGGVKLESLKAAMSEALVP